MDRKVGYAQIVTTRQPARHGHGHAAPRSLCYSATHRHSNYTVHSTRGPRPAHTRARVAGNTASGRTLESCARRVSPRVAGCHQTMRTRFFLHTKHDLRSTG
jgi:hypothetical protein